MPLRNTQCSETLPDRTVSIPPSILSGHSVNSHPLLSPNKQAGNKRGAMGEGVEGGTQTKRGSVWGGVDGKKSN